MEQLEALGGVGALMGTAMAGRVSRRLGLGPAPIVCLGGSRLAVLLIPLARGPGWLAATCLVGHQLLGDALLMGYYVLATSLRQSVLPRRSSGGPTRRSTSPPACSSRWAPWSPGRSPRRRASARRRGSAPSSDWPRR